jgi:predicted FMN-binding regulatory protein PaiB
MYFPKHHGVFDLPTLQAFVRTYPLGLFTTAIKSDAAPTLQTTHIPWVLDAADDGTPGVLRGHMARANPQAKQLIELGKQNVHIEDEVLVLFNAPVHSYVTPKFYTETKPSTGKVVPTWNYAAVQVYGKLRVYTENNAETAAYLSKMVSDLSDQQEKAAGHESPWKVTDAPEKYTNLLMKAIIGVEITIDRIEGRFKLSQEKQDGDWEGVIAGFRALGTPEGETMANMVEEQGKMRSAEA